MSIHKIDVLRMDKSTSVIIINFNAGDALLRSVASVLKLEVPLHLIVADNASNDGSCEKLKNRFADDSRLLVIENKKKWRILELPARSLSCFLHIFSFLRRDK